MARPTRDRDDDKINVIGASGGAPASPPIEIVVSRDEVVLASGDAGRAAQRYRMLEVWTRNRVYIVDSALECIEVTDRRTGASEAAHFLVGARLVGGQRKYAKTMHLSRPFPVPGTEAIFVREGKQSAPAGLTSKVERVVLHIHIVSVAMEKGADAWDDVTSHLLQHQLGREE